MIIGILWGIYFNNIFPIFLLILIVYNIPVKNKKFIKIKKLYLKRYYIILFLVVSFISNIYVIRLESRYENFIKTVPENITMKAIIKSYKKEGTYKYRYIAKIVSLNNKKVKGINLYIFVNKDNVNFDYGDIVEVTGEFKKFSSPKNYKSFDYGEYLKKDNIYGSCIVEDIKCVGEKKTFLKMFKIINKEISCKIQYLFDKDEGGFLEGILLGNKDNIDESIINDFKDSSLSHILAVSGTHISYIILAINIILSKTNLGKKFLKIVIIITLLIFMLIIGASASVIRAVFMGIIMISSGFFYRKADTVNSMNISIILTLLYNPYYIKDYGFLLSYGGVIGIVCFYKIFKEKFENILEKNKIQKFIKESLILSFSVQIVLIPISTMIFNKISILFFISNIIVLPLIGLTIISSIFIIAISFISTKIVYPFARLINLILKLIIQISKIIASVPFSNILVVTPKVIYVIIYYIFLILFYSEFMQKISIHKIFKINFKLLKRIIIVFLIIVVVVDKLIFFMNSDLTVHFIDVGQR